jgi:predicted anti-sigma-YlaC factor YlaD
MKENRHLALRALLWIICVYHVVCGLMANLFPSRIPALAETLAGMKVGAASEFIYLAKPLGIYAIAFGVMMGLAAWNPIKNRALISVGIVLFALRIAQRLAGIDEMQSVFGVSPTRSLVTIALVACFGLALAWLRFQLHRELQSAERTPVA